MSFGSQKCIEKAGFSLTGTAHCCPDGGVEKWVCERKLSVEDASGARKLTFSRRLSAPMLWDKFCRTPLMATDRGN